MVDVDEELRTASVWASSVGHGKTALLIAVFRDVFVLDVATIGAALSAASLQVLEGAIWRASSSCPSGLRVFGVRASELVHETGDDSVEMDSFVQQIMTKCMKGEKRQNWTHG